MNPLRETYEAAAYPVGIHPHTFVPRIAALARVFGLRPAGVEGCRVLELGCSQAVNLLAQADRLPEGKFTGVDFSAPDITAGRAMAAEAGLGNVTLHHGNFLSFDPGGEKFDYIIAHGIFSWVPDDVKDRLLALCRECLAPDGIAYISYATYPGDKERDSIRDLLRLRTAGCETPDEKLAEATRVMRFMDQALEGQKENPYAAGWREVVRRGLEKQPNQLLHDELGLERDPCYLLQFTDWAAEHGLQYVADCDFSTMLLENLPPAAASELAAMQLNRLETEQMIDYVIHRSFRRSLLTHQENAVEFQADGACLPALCVNSRLKAEKRLRPGQAEARFLHPESGGKIKVRGEALVAAVGVLGLRPHDFIRFEEVLAEARCSDGRDFSAAEIAGLCADVVTLFGKNLVQLSVLPVAPAAGLPPRPRLSGLNRILADRERMVINAFHSPVPLSAIERTVCALLDGSRTVAELIAVGGMPAAELAKLLDGLLRAGCLVEG